MLVRKPHLNANPQLDYAVGPIEPRFTKMIACRALSHNSDTHDRQHQLLKPEPPNLRQVQLPCMDLAVTLTLISRASSDTEAILPCGIHRLCHSPSRLESSNRPPPPGRMPVRSNGLCAAQRG